MLRCLDVRRPGIGAIDMVLEIIDDPRRTVLFSTHILAEATLAFIRRRAEAAVRVDVGYYALGNKPTSLSPGTRASVVGVIGATIAILLAAIASIVGPSRPRGPCRSCCS